MKCARAKIDQLDGVSLRTAILKNLTEPIGRRKGRRGSHNDAVSEENYFPLCIGRRVSRDAMGKENGENEKEAKSFK